ncbi:hypothetical protein JCM3775_006950 [Rhodotorula graminis]|uniref:rRNA-processing protein n=1 Tax=Rhodotorula graminis (strain WP1) TaxID=578459 RepID=A0A194SFZ8_RHOGW|nr:uncharacterized protein RHOBADRAFT_51012 [Rhodotorula graminis WP1]KPV78556.1 hypothetical protein RHOBADRAFT_51012 [Rhodotorula graminis WP1]
MVPKPVWHDRPVEKTYDPEVKTDAAVPELETPLATKVSGRWWKGDNKPTVRTSAGSKNKDQLDKAWKARAERNQRDKAVKLIEKEIKEEKVADLERKKEITKQRREREAEKLRLEQMAARMSAKKLQRMKKRLGRSKKVAG